MAENESRAIDRFSTRERSPVRVAFGHILDRGWSGNFQRIRRNGLIWAVNSVRLHLRTFIAHHVNSLYDKRYNIDTAGFIELGDLELTGTSKSSAFHYEPISPRSFRKTMAHLPADLQEYTFVDFGSGKGRTLLLAGERNFKSVIGVELDRGLHDTAEANIRKCQNIHKKCNDVKSLCMDAVNFTFDNNKYVLFFFSPFQENITRYILQRLNMSMEGRSGHILLCYTDEYWSTIIPLEIFKQAGFTVKVGMTHVRWDVAAPTQIKYVIYERIYHRSCR